MIAEVLASAGLVVGLVIGLGRQFVVFAVFEPGIGIFRHYQRKRNVGILAVLVLCAAAISLSSVAREGIASMPVIVMSIAAGLLSLFAVVFNLERLFPALDHVEVKTADNGEIPDDLLVFVAHVGSVQRAYALEQTVMARHLVHDTVGEQPIVVTYCALCRSGLVFRAEVDHQLTFRVVGVFRRNLIMEDLETHTLWQQATGVAIHGSLRGTTLEMLPSEQTTWGNVRKRPHITFAVEPAEAKPAPFASDRGFALLEAATLRVMPPGRTRLSRALSPHETVFGIQLEGHTRAYPLSHVKTLGTFTDQIDDMELEFTYHSDRDILEVNRLDGKPAPIVERHWWLGWHEFHPQTTVFTTRSANSQ